MTTYIIADLAKDLQRINSNFCAPIQFASVAHMLFKDPWRHFNYFLSIKHVLPQMFVSSS